jgi:hypothetical protein
MTTFVTSQRPRPAAPQAELSATRLNLMRAGYLLMAVGITLGRTPRLLDAHAGPLYEGVTLSMLTAMSLLAFVGLHRPVAMLPVLLFESTWKLLWLSVVALPRAVGGDLDPATSEVAVNCSLVVVILAVTPWRHVWRHYVRAAGDRWR